MRDVAEILEHWQAERSICVISRSFGVYRNTARKYMHAARVHGEDATILEKDMMIIYIVACQAIRCCWGQVRS